MRKELLGDWTLRGGGRELEVEKTPSTVMHEYSRQGLLPDPYYRLDEGTYLPLADQPYEYACTFENEGMEGADAVRLVFEGLDTYAEIRLNGERIGKTDNMFVPHSFEVKELLRPGANNLSIEFESPIHRPKELFSKSFEEHGSPIAYYRGYIRKAQYSFGWDWGPRMPDIGIWRPVYWEIDRKAAIRDLFVQTREIGKSSAVLAVEADIAVYGDFAPEAQLRLSLDGTEKLLVRLPVKNGRIEEKITVEEPELWWPNGYGKQPLYEAELTLALNGEAIDSRTQTIGIRTVRLIRENDDFYMRDKGQSFIFEVNGRRIYARGANWVPMESMLPRVRPERYREWIKMAHDTNMNMLRIWGGGIYEDDAFYDNCDKYGILVWQDFMFACAEYPDVEEWFRESISAEAEAIVKRLRGRTCIALWCGNNENNWGFVDWWKRGRDCSYFGNYLYLRLLPDICNRLDPGRYYWPGSPHGGGEHPNGMTHGDRHSWDVWNGSEPDIYVNDTGRFISEFGMQAMPTWKTVTSYTLPEDRRLISPVIRLHNKNNDGMLKLQKYLVTQAGLPKDFRSFCLMTQLVQAESIKIGVQHWRARKFATAGALYWQLNDCWPVASWSCADYYLRKKALYYYTKSFFAPVAIRITKDSGGVRVTLINDTAQEVKGQLKIGAVMTDGTNCGETTIELSAKPDENAVSGIIGYSEIGIPDEQGLTAVDGFCSVFSEYRNIALQKTMVWASFEADGHTAADTMWFEKLIYVPLEEPGINVRLDGAKAVLTCKKPAVGVFLETENDVEASDNCLTLRPGTETTVTFSAPPGDIEVFDLHKMRL